MVALPSWLKAARQCNISLEPVLREHNIDLDASDPMQTVVSTQVMMQAMASCTKAAAAQGGQHFPFVLGTVFAFEYLADIEVFLATSPNLRAALQVLQWLPRVIDPHLSAAIVEDGNMACIELCHHDLQPGFEGYAHHSSEVTFSGILRLVRLLLGDPLGDQFALAGICWRQAEPAGRRSAYEAHFGTPMHFGQKADAMRFDRAWLDRPLPHVAPSLHEAARQRVEQRLDELVPPTSLHGVAARLEQLLSTSPDLLGQAIGDIAARLGVHERTLQRRLRAKGIAYSDLQDRVRFRLAKRWLRQSDMPIDEIGEQLGFADRRGFARAFARWANISPSAYRRMAAP